MVKNTAAWLIFIALMLIFGSQADALCQSPDNLRSVSGTAHCLAIKTHSPPRGPTKTLVVVLHGDLSSGDDADYIIPVASRAASYGSIGVAIARPGYTLDGRTSSGEPTRDQSRDDRYTAYEINSIAAAVASLKKHHGAERVVMIGHSGGAIFSGVMLGSAAPLVDVAILVSCPCDVPNWRSANGWEPLENAESPVDHLSDVPKSSKIIALTGKRDKNTWPGLAQDYVKKASSMGLDATFYMVEFARHRFSGIGGSDEFTESLIQAVRSR